MDSGQRDLPIVKFWFIHDLTVEKCVKACETEVNSRD